jgi:hypothetical protein
MSRIRAIRYLLLILTAIGLSTCVVDHQDVEQLIQKLRKKYVHQHYEINPVMASIFVDDTQPGGKELKVLLDKVSKMEVLVFSEESQVNKNQFSPMIVNINRSINRFGLIQYGGYSTNNENITVWLIKKKSIITDLIVEVISEGNAYMVYYSGQIPLATLDLLVNPKNRPILKYLYRLKSSTVR